MYENLSTPAVLVELDIVERNIKKMIDEAAKYGITHRPHTKVHKSVELSKLQEKYGAKGITCAKISEAEIMADGGLQDILIAYPVIGKDKCERYAKLAGRVKRLMTIVNSVEGARGLSEAGKAASRRLPVLIELDGGTRRGGIEPGPKVLEFANKIKDFDGIEIVGLMYYPGAIYSEHTQEGIERVARKERDDLVNARDLLNANGFNINILSGGNTPSSKVPYCLEGITEIRAGNYIFNDCAQLYYNRVTEDDCGLRVLSTVICRPDEYNAILDCGTKSLAADFYPNTDFGYGRIVGRPELNIFNLNEEHAFVRSPEKLDLKIGDKVMIIPNHACVVPNLTIEMYGVRNGKVDHMINVDARAQSV